MSAAKRLNVLLSQFDSKSNEFSASHQNCAASLNAAPTKYREELIANAKAIAARGKGILAADESTGTIGKRLASIKLPNTEPYRRAYRQLLFTTPNIGKHISGCILYEETLFQKSDDGVPFVTILQKAGVIPGIKVDAGTTVIPGTDNETATLGLDGLDKRCQKYYKAGARFAKWRAVLKIAKGCPSETAIKENAWGLARYAAICQQNGLVPIVEPEILMDGNHDIETAAVVTERVLAAVYKALADNHVMLEGTLLKPNMCLAGYDTGKKADPETVARYTYRALRRRVPASVPGIMFLSGGQSEEQAVFADSSRAA